MKNICLLIVLIVLFSCNTTEEKSNSKKKTIVCTTGMLGDLVQNMVKDKYHVITLMGPGVDPHLYKATQGDLKSLSDAEIIVYNGLHLEGKMGEIFEKLENRKHIIVAAKAIPDSDLINNTDFQGAYDPHLWFDVKLWSKVAEYIGNELANLDEENKKELRSNIESYLSKLEILHQETIENLNQLDSSKRVLITAHDAFGYFGKAYQFEVKGLQGISTVSEYGLKDVSNLVNFITEREIKAVFVESSVSDRSLKAVTEGCKSKGHHVKIGGTLFSDAMGEAGTIEGTYIGMVQYNVNTIIHSLK